MHFLSPLLLVAAAATLSSAGDVLRSTSLRTCMVNSGFTATLFNVSFTPEDGRLIIHINGGSTVTGRVTAKLTVLAYGFPVIEQLINPCDTPDLTAMCPLTILPLDWTLTRTVPESTRKQIPAIAYKIPDLDGVARMEVINDLGKVVACVEAPLSNGQTVEHSFVGWITALISAAALVASAVVSGMGHSSTAAHLAANALSLFTYFQAQAMVAMMAVPLPPLAAAWSQNFNWALGVIRVKFMQRIFHWYVLATGGTTTNLFKEQELVSVQILKRDTVDVDPYLRSRAASYGFAQAARLMPRSNSGFVVYYPTEVVKVTGIDRMSYKAKIEASNLFMTGMSFYVALFCLVLIVVSGFRLLCKTSAITKHDRFREFRAKWLVVLKGIMYRIILIGFPPIVLAPIRVALIIPD